METKELKSSKLKETNALTVPIRVKRETKRRIQLELSRVNKKSLGRTVRVDALLAVALKYITDADILALQNDSLSNADRMEQQYREFLKANPGTTKDSFLGKLLSNYSVKIPGPASTSEGFK